METASTENEDYKGDIKTFEAVLVLRYDKVYLKKPFDVFRENLINYVIK